MTKEKWQELVIKIENSFELIDQGSISGEQKNESIEFIEWQMPGKQIRAEAHERPKLLDKKTFYSNRIGSKTSEQYIYSEDEVVFFVNFFERFDENDEWQEMKSGDFV